MSHANAFLTIAPPVVVPTQIPLGALMFSAALKDNDLHSILYDASLDFFQFAVSAPKSKMDTDGKFASLQRRALRAVSYFQTTRIYKANHHRTQINNFHQYINQWCRQFPDWQISLTDVNFARILPQEPDAFIAYLKSGHETPFTQYIQKKLFPEIRAIGIKNIGISLTYISQIYFALELGLFLKENGLQALIGGALVNILDTRTQSRFDFAHLFLREHPLVPAHLASENLRQYPTQWPELVKKPDEYYTPVPVVPFLLSKGCYWNKCLFCPDNKSGYHPFPTNSIRRFLETAFSQTVKNEIIFNIADSAIPAAQLEKMLPFFKSVNCEFYGFFRFEKTFAAEGYFESLSEAGARLVQFGLESGSQRILNLYRKGNETDLTQTILQKAHQAGLKNYVYLLFGLPTETDTDRNTTLDFVRQNSESIHFLNIALFNLPVDCEILKHPEKYDIRVTEDSRYQKPLQFYVPFTSSQGAVRDQARRFIQQKLKRDPLIRPIVLNTPHRIRIDHAVFFES